MRLICWACERCFEKSSEQLPNSQASVIIYLSAYRLIAEYFIPHQHCDKNLKPRIPLRFRPVPEKIENLVSAGRN